MHAVCVYVCVWGGLYHVVGCEYAHALFSVYLSSIAELQNAYTAYCAVSAVENRLHVHNVIIVMYAHDIA